MPQVGRTIALCGETGSGKTTLAGEYAKHIRKTRGLNTVLHSSDRGGFDSISSLVRLGVITPDVLGPGDDPWLWIADAVKGSGEGIGLHIFDGGTSISEALLSAAAKSPFLIGQRPNQKLTVTKGDRTLSVGTNTDAHYGVVQSFMLDQIWQSTYLILQGIDVLWTFGVHRSEEQDRTPVIGPKLAGKALTAAIPKWFNFFFHLSSIPVDDDVPRHVLHLTEHSELAGLGHSFGNARYPKEAVTPLPPSIEPASLVKALELFEAGQAEADLINKQELGL